LYIAKLNPVSVMLYSPQVGELCRFVNVTLGESYVNDLRSVPTSELKLTTERIDGPAPAEVARHSTAVSDFHEVVLHEDTPMDAVGEAPRLPKLKPYTVTLEPADVGSLGGAL
jgi:hypothetical protein